MSVLSEYVAKKEGRAPTPSPTVTPQPETGGFFKRTARAIGGLFGKEEEKPVTPVSGQGATHQNGERKAERILCGSVY